MIVDINLGVVRDVRVRPWTGTSSMCTVEIESQTEGTVQLDMDDAGLDRLAEAIRSRKRKSRHGCDVTAKALAVN